MNDWEIGGTQNKWVCPSDRHLQLRAQLKAGWSVRTATARSPTNSKANSGITDAEQEHIRQVLAKAEESRLKEMERLGKMVERLEKMKSRATGNGVTHCVLCKTEFGLLASKSYAAMCNDCRKYVCQRNCGVETMDPTRGTEMIFLCKICSEAREVLWKKSGAWFYKELPEFVKPEPPNGNVSSPPMHSRSAWVLGTIPRNSPSTSSMPTAAASSSITNSMIPPEKAPRRHLPIAPPEPRSSSDGEFVQSGVPRKPQRTPSANRREANLARFSALQAAIRDNDSESDDDSSPESRASTRSTSPRRSLATPSSYDSSQKDLRQSDTIGPDDARSIDSGVVQSDHSNPQAALTLSASSLAPLANHINDSTSNSRMSQDYTNARIAQSASGSSLVTPPPIPPRTNSPNRASDERQSSIECAPSMKLSFSSAASTKRAGTSSDSVNVPADIPKPPAARVESPSASFMSSPDDDSNLIPCRADRASQSSRSESSDSSHSSRRSSQSSNVNTISSAPHNENHENKCRSTSPTAHSSQSVEISPSIKNSYLHLHKHNSSSSTYLQPASVSHPNLTNSNLTSDSKSDDEDAFRSRRQKTANSTFQRRRHQSQQHHRSSQHLNQSNHHHHHYHHHHHHEDDNNDDNSLAGATSSSTSVSSSISSETSLYISEHEHVQPKRRFRKASRLFTCFFVSRNRMSTFTFYKPKLNRLIFCQ